MVRFILTVVCRTVKEIRRNIVQMAYVICCTFTEKRNLVVISSKNSHQFRNIPILCRQLLKERVKFKLIDANISLRNIYILSTAKVVCIDQATKLTSNLILCDTTDVIQIWHAGGAYKKVGFDASDGSSFDLKRINRIHGNTKWIIITSNKLRDTYATAFNLPLEHVLPLGMLRTDLYFKSDRKFRQNKKIVLFAPTFRIFDKRRTIAGVGNVIRELKGKLKKYDYELVVRLHPSVANQLSINSIINWSDRELLDCFNEISVLVTDYSSIFFDFSLFYGRIFWYLEDIDDYQKERGLYFNPLIDYPEYASRNLDDLVKKIAFNDNENCHIIRERFMDNCDGHSSQRIINFIKSLL